MITITKDGTVRLTTHPTKMYKSRASSTLFASSHNSTSSAFYPHPRARLGQIGCPFCIALCYDFDISSGLGYFPFSWIEYLFGLLTGSRLSATLRQVSQTCRKSPRSRRMTALRSLRKGMKKLIRNVEEIAHTNRYSRTDDIKVHIKAETGPKLTLTFGQLAKYIPLFSRRTPHEDLIFSIIDGYTNKFTVEFIHRWILQQSKNKGWQQWKDDAALTTEEQFFSAYRFASNGTAPEMYHHLQMLRCHRIARKRSLQRIDLAIKYLIETDTPQNSELSYYLSAMILISISEAKVNKEKLDGIASKLGVDYRTRLILDIARMMVNGVDEEMWEGVQGQSNEAYEYLTKPDTPRNTQNFYDCSKEVLRDLCRQRLTEEQLDRRADEASVHHDMRLLIIAAKLLMIDDYEWKER